MSPRSRFKRGASIAGSGGLSYRLGAYGRSHAQSFFSSLGRLIETPFSTIIAILVVGVALSLPTVFYVFVDNARLVSSRFVDSNQFTLYLHPDVSDIKAATVAGKLLKRPEIISATLITKNQALEEFNQYSGFSGAIEILESNPLPATIRINPQTNLNPEQLERFALEIESLPEADFAQFDLKWVRRLQAMMNIAESSVEMLSLLLGVGVIFIVSNTIRLELRTRQDEIIVSKLLGATDAFVRRPFLYSGFWFGFGGGIVAAILVTIVLLYFDGPIRHLALLYETDYELVYLGPSRLFTLLISSSLLGIVGAGLVLAHQLHKMNPGK